MNARRSKILKLKSFLRSEVFQKPRLWLITPPVNVSKVPGKQINQSVAVKVAPACADRMAAAESRGRRHDSVLFGRFTEHTFAIVDPQQVRLQAIVGNINVEVAILIEVARCDAASSQTRFRFRQPE